MIENKSQVMVASEKYQGVERRVNPMLRLQFELLAEKKYNDRYLTLTMGNSQEDYFKGKNYGIQIALELIEASMEKK